MTSEKGKEYHIWEKLKNGNDQDFSDFYDAYVDSLFSFGLVYSNDQQLIKDAIHDLFVDLFKYRKKLKSDVNIKGYLFKALKRKIQQNQKRRNRLTFQETITDADTDAGNQIQESFPGSEENEWLGKVLILIEKLPKRQKEALILKYQKELSYSEVAELMDVSVESARTLIYRTIKTLRKDLQGGKVIVLFTAILSNVELSK